MIKEIIPILAGVILSRPFIKEFIRLLKTKKPNYNWLCDNWEIVLAIGLYSLGAYLSGSIGMFIAQLLSFIPALLIILTNEFLIRKEI